jgi:3-oxoacyl-[acyl-carrier-protein] synthase II
MRSDVRARSEPGLNVSGIGVVFSGGRGVGALQDALQRGWTPPPRGEVPALAGEGMPVYAVEQKTLMDKAVLKNMRRADRFSKMAVLAAWDALEDSGVAIQGGRGTLGIILATAFGPQVTAFRFLDEIIDYGDTGVSPTLFSHSVHNAAASYVSSALENRGPTLTLTQFAFSFHQALILARAWIREGRCQNVLVGSVEECGAVMEYICSEQLLIAEDGRIKPFAFSPSPAAVPGEGSVFLLLTRSEGPKRYCELRGASVDAEAGEGSPDLRILDADGMSADETCYAEVAGQGPLAASYSPLFGSMMTGSAFHCASAALMLMNQVRYASPVQDNPHGIEMCAVTEKKKIETVQCMKFDCLQEKAIIELER